MDADIYNVKRRFIESQVRLLSLPSETSSSFVARHAQFASSVATGRVLKKVHVLERKHARKYYSLQAIQHVALQITSLHNSQVTSAREHASALVSVTGDQPAIHNVADLLDRKVIDALPEEWPGNNNSNDDEDSQHDRQKFSQLRDKLLSLSSALSAAKRKHDRLASMESEIAKFNDPVVTVQPNLVSRSGLIEAELARMRILLARISSKVE
ncbi:kinetochore Sim4 complex subunit Fta4 [Lipomyces japonicus]|uniref:kinetochore Sim4 complex subunit Fta4 n=1 Tax=Lipomyces japonicus TaxID=56871 RepID=UPI0034CE4BBE